MADTSTSPSGEVSQAELRRFFCVHNDCGHVQNYIIYPSESALRIECECGQIYWWSRKQKKLFREATQEEMHPDQMLLMDSWAYDNSQK